MSLLRDIASEILSEHGALVEEDDGQETLSVVAPPALQKIFDIPEFARLGFESATEDNIIRVTLESDWIERLQSLDGQRGTYLTGSAIPTATRKHPSAQDAVPKHLALQNATYRIQKDYETQTRYLLLTFHITALSDEKREEILELCFNESNGADGGHLVEPILAHIRNTEEMSPLPENGQPLCPPWSIPQIISRCSRVIPTKVHVGLQRFIASLERRMAKDLDQLHAYHSDLQKEAAIKARATHHKGGSPEATAKLEEARLAAIEREYRSKVADLNLKYAMSVNVNLIQAARITTPVHRYEVLVLRRKGQRLYHLDWSPLSKQFDTCSCEFCGDTPKSLLVCDDHLHLMCPTCHGPCAHCGKIYCKQCHPTRCPHCARNAT
jgi:hypothetical protein